MQNLIRPEIVKGNGEQPATSNPSFDTTIVMCVESGALEHEAILLVQTVRNWGGWLSGAPIFAVQPRVGPGLDRRTLAFFRQNHVEYVKRLTPAHASWRGSLNKTKALSYVERVSPTEMITWLDTDLLIVAEPDGLALGPDEDFAACPCGDGYHSTTGPGHRNEAYWQTLFDQFNIDSETIGWQTTWPKPERIRTYWQAGLYSYRRSSQLGQVHYETHCQLMKSRISHNISGIFHYDQTSLTIAVRRAGLRCRVLPFDHNLQFNQLFKAEECPSAADVAAAKVVHYHGFMWPESFPRFLEQIRPLHTDIRKLVENNGPIDKRRTLLHRRLITAVLRRYNALRYRQFEKSCRIV
jgi:hypothetical protein